MGSTAALPRDLPGELAPLVDGLVLTPLSDGLVVGVRDESARWEGVRDPVEDWGLKAPRLGLSPPPVPLALLMLAERELARLPRVEPPGVGVADAFRDVAGR